MCWRPDSTALPVNAKTLISVPPVTLKKGIHIKWKKLATYSAPVVLMQVPVLPVLEKCCQTVRGVQSCQLLKLVNCPFSVVYSHLSMLVNVAMPTARIILARRWKASSNMPRNAKENRDHRILLPIVRFASNSSLSVATMLGSVMKQSVLYPIVQILRTNWNNNSRCTSSNNSKFFAEE